MSADEVLLDVAPCEVLLPDGQLVRRARAWVTQRGLVVYVEETPYTTPVRVYAARHSAEPEVDDTRKVRRRQRHVVHTEEGDVIINPTLGCLCGMPTLRAYTYDTVRLETRGVQV